MNFLDKVKQEEERLQDSIKSKIARGEALNDNEISAYTLTDDDKKILDMFNKLSEGKSTPGFELKDFLATPQAAMLIPRIIIGAMRKSAEPLYLASNFYKRIKLKAGYAMYFPSIGVMRAYDVAEGQEIPQETIDWQQHKTSLIQVGKSGVRVQVTEELLKDSDWDIVGMLLSEAGRAMARHKEQKAFTEWIKHGWVVFDNNLKHADGTPWTEAKTTGVDFSNNLNNTMSIDDFLDLVIAVYNNEYTATDMIMHPLAWVSFAKNGLSGVYTALSDDFRMPEGPNASFKIGPQSMQGRLPFSFNVNLSPFAPIDKVNKTFDMFIVDKNNVGVLIVKDDLTTEEFRDPSRDIRNVKIIERYGYGTYNEGRAVCMAKNISMARGYSQPQRVHNV